MIEEPWVIPLPSPALEEAAEGAPEGCQRLVEPLPVHPYRQCTHAALGDADSTFLQNWREKHWEGREDFVPSNCSHAARVLLNGQPLCRRHAGMILLAKCEEMGL